MADVQCQFTWVTVGNLVVSLATPGSVPQDAVDRFLRDLNEKQVKKYLATVIGAAQLNGVQRKQVSEVYRRLGLQVAVLADEVLTRGIVTALGWLGVNIKAFSWKDIRTALQYLEVSKSFEDQAIQAVSRLREGSGIKGPFMAG
jgi:hypothetical protein